MAWPKRTLLPLPDALPYPNGMIPSSQLVVVYGGNSRTKGLLCRTPARGFNAMQGACHRDTGVWLSFTGTCYRSFQSQVNLLLSRTSVVKEAGSPWSRLWRGVRYWASSDGNGHWPAPCATPGTSNHGEGKAIDFALLNAAGSPTVGITSNRTVWLWLLGNATRFGFCWESDVEPWHLTWYVGATIPAAVLNWERGVKPNPGNPLPPPDPVNVRPSPEEPDMLMFVWKPHITDPPAGQNPDDPGLAWFAQFSSGHVRHVDQALANWCAVQNPAVVPVQISVSWGEYQRVLAESHWYETAGRPAA